MFLDATYVKGRVRGRVVSRAVVIATGVTATGDREVLGVDVGDSEDGAFWTSFCKGLRARGLTRVQLVISDHHLGLKAAIGAVFVGAAWQRCRVHFMRNVLSRVPKASAEMVAAAVRTIFAQPDPAHVRSQLDEVTRMLHAQFPDVAAMLTDTAEDLLAFTGFPIAHWRKIWSTNPLDAPPVAHSVVDPHRLTPRPGTSPEIAGYIDTYHHRPHSGLAYRTPTQVAQTWQDHQDLQTEAT